MKWAILISEEKAWPGQRREGRGVQGAQGKTLSYFTTAPISNDSPLVLSRACLAKILFLQKTVPAGLFLEIILQDLHIVIYLLLRV